MADMKSWKVPPALLACDWGLRVSLPGDSRPCTAWASRQMVLHGPGGEQHYLRVCHTHGEVLERETNPHGTGWPA